MRKLLAIILWLIAIALCTFVLRTQCPKEMRNHQTLTNQLSIPEPYRSLYEEVLAPVVKITTPQGTGSGVIISDTYILTAAHVVGNESEVQVTFYTYRRDAEYAEIFNGTVIITDTIKDLALLRITHNALRITHYARLAPRDYKPYLFTEVYAVGCSLGFNPRPSEGILSASAVNHWEVSAPILPGNSGGGVFLKDTHKLIGIAVWVRTYHGQLITTMAGIVPINQIYEFLGKVHELTSPRVNESKKLRVKSSVVPQGGLGADFNPVRCLLSNGVTSWSGRGSDGAIGTGGPAGQPYLRKGVKKHGINN